MPVPCELRSTGPQDRCKSARGPDADLRRNILIYFISEGSRFGADSHLAQRLPKKNPELGSSGLNVNVAAPLLGQFGNDNLRLERMTESRIE